MMFFQLREIFFTILAHEKRSRILLLIKHRLLHGDLPPQPCLRINLMPLFKMASGSGGAVDDK